MPRGSSAAGSAGDWLARARGDLAVASAPLPEGAYREDLCYHAQQAAEESLKAVYVHRGLRFRYVHDIGELVAGLAADGLTVPSEMRDAAALSVYASEARYPSLAAPPLLASAATQGDGAWG